MKFLGLFLLASVCFLACRHKKNSDRSGNNMVEVKDFFDFFQPVKLPFTITDKAMDDEEDDSLLIGNKVVSEFISDTVFNNFFSKKTHLKFYPIGRVALKNGETYLFLDAVAPSKKTACVLAFDKENNFRAALPLIVIGNDDGISQSATMDARYTIMKNRQRKKANGDLAYHKEAYVYNNVGSFTLILTESNEDLTRTGVLFNPIDTFPRKHKFSGDYVRDKKNIVSIRDGKNSSQFRFFIHFEQDKGTCKGEMRGEGHFVKPNLAVFRVHGDPCELQFAFTPETVSLSELSGCGNYRDIKCFFEGTFPRKKFQKSTLLKKQLIKTK